jgi:hypothetical protein
MHNFFHGNWDSVVGYGLDELEVGVRVSVGSRIFPSPCLSERLWGPPSPTSTGGFSTGLKLPGREADHSPSASVKVMKTSTPPNVFIV